MHDAYHSKDVTDLNVFRADAARRLKDARHPEETIIHLHRYTEPCSTRDHEYFLYEQVELPDAPQAAGVNPESGMLIWGEPE